ncbi:MAG: FAD-dependent monooxygenase [Opitutaceae bacterium]
MFNHKTVDIAVLGAGPAGLTAAHTLADKGMDFVLFDKEAHTNTETHALALHPETLELLEKLGVLDPVLETATKLHRASIFDHAQVRRAVINYGELPVKYPFLAVIGQDELESILVRTLKEKGHKPMWHHRARGIEQTDSNVTFTVDRLTEGMTGYAVAHMETEIDKIFEYQANYLIAADGYSSQARKSAGIIFPEMAHSIDYAIFEFDTDAKLLTEMCMTLDGDRTHVYWPLGKRRCRFSFQMSAEFTGRGAYNKEHEMVDEAAQHAPELEDSNLKALLKAHAPWFTGTVDEVKWRTMVHFEKHLVDRFGNNRIWLAGDAAHMTPPAGMLSMNIGMHEAADLATRLSTDQSDEVREFRLHAYDNDHMGEWKRLLDINHHLIGHDTTAKWLLEHRDNIIGNLPASGESLTAILKQLHLTEAA